MIRPHECRVSRTCTCSVQGLEPADDCPIHTGPVYPPRCAECGRFLPISPVISFTIEIKNPRKMIVITTE